MRFIVVDGLDGSGKTTQARLILKYCQTKGENIIIREHPSSDNPWGVKAKGALLGRGKLNKIRASFYYALDVIRSVRHYHGKADTVIFVRYLMGVAYLPLPLAKLFYWLFCTVLPTSNYMFFLDVDPAESHRRMAKRPDEEMFENLDDLVEVRKKALQLTENWHVIDTSGSVEDSHKSIMAILDGNSSDNA